MKPLLNNVFIEIKREKETESGIIIPETANKERPVVGKVAFIGEKVVSVKPGDKVLVKKWMVDELNVDNKDYLVGTEDAVMAVL